MNQRHKTQGSNTMLMNDVCINVSYKHRKEVQEFCHSLHTIHSLYRKGEQNRTRIPLKGTAGRDCSPPIQYKVKP